ncbi:DeoR/GlpR family DNA-binding transcription regulator [Actinopolymorpha alba]|uniref:DeoR/GlpR family DNA-binding transcription regulator n=1 Tax=Actinopolymorpha alba TaxID=533267 RepID=UPI00037592DB|nr:DeoR/GlpR family DNA-binding transcription regulator [Actinopolymorpha alba]
MLQRERDRRIVRALRAQGTVSAMELATQLGVSTATIRRDLERLDRNGELKRVYGGAMLLDESGEEPPFAVSHDKESLAKEAVAARAAADLVEDDDVLLLDIGTTTSRLARHLHGRRVTVITSNIAVFDELRDDPEVQLILLGGMLRRNYRSLVGSLAEAALQQVSADRVFLSCTGIRRDGQVVDDMMVEASTKRSMIAAAESVVLLAQPHKFPGKGSLKICSLTEIDVLITTPDADKETVDICRQAGGKVLIT